MDRFGIDQLSHHGGTMNGQLKATHGLLVEYGIHRAEITAAIEVAIAPGFVKRTSVRRLRVDSVGEEHHDQECDHPDASASRADRMIAFTSSM